MNKTIEREFYVSDEYREGLINELIYPYSRFKSTLLPNKIKIIIEVPEREATVKEGDLDRYSEEWKHDPTYTNNFPEY
jgi:hypothetical protein